MKKDNKTCILCGKKYSFCNRCEEYDHLPRWMAIYCSDNCRVIFNEISAYNMKLRSKKDAAKNISECDLSRKDEFNAQCQKYINEILDIKEEAQDTVVNNEVKVETATDEINKETLLEPAVKQDVELQTKPKRMKYTSRKKQ